MRTTLRTAIGNVRAEGENGGSLPRHATRSPTMARRWRYEYERLRRENLTQPPTPSVRVFAAPTVNGGGPSVAGCSRGVRRAFPREGFDIVPDPCMVRVWVGALEIGDRSCVGADGRYGVDLDQLHHLPPW